MMPQLSCLAPRVARSTLRGLFALLVLLGWAAAACAQQARPTGILFLTINTPPLAYFENGRLTGFGVDLLNRLAERMGQSARIEMGAYADNVKRIQENPAAALFPTSRIPSWEKRYKWVGPLIPERICLYADAASGISLASLEAAKHVRSIATVGGYASEIFLRERGFANIVSHRSPSQCADSLKYGRVDLWLNSDVTMASLARQADVEPETLKNVFTVAEFPSYLAFSPETPDEIVDAWQRELDMMKADGGFEELRARWLLREERGLDYRRGGGPQVEFSPEERAWLAQHPVLRMGAGIAGEPLDFQDEQGRHAGYSADVLQLLSERTGLVFEARYGLVRDQIDRAMAERSIDMAACLAVSPGQRSPLLFTVPYSRFPAVIITAAGARSVDGPEDLSGETVAVVGAAMSRPLQEQAPGARPLPVDSVDEALRAVSEGRAFATMGNLGSLGYQIRVHGLTNLKVAALVETDAYELAVGVRSDWPLLRDILNKALATISEEEQAAIMARWVAPSSPSSGVGRIILPWAWGAAAAFSAALLTLGLRNRRLKREVAERARTERSLARSERRFRELFDNAQVGIFEARLENGGRFVSANRRLVEILGYEGEEELLERPALSEHLSDPAEAARLERAMASPLGFLRLRSGLRRHSGETVWVELSGQIEGGEGGLVTGIVQDQTEQVQAQQALQASEALLRAVLDAIPFFVCLFGPDRRFRMVNRAGCDLLGLEFDKLVGRHIGDVVPEEVWALFKPAEDKALAGTPSILEMSTDYARRRGAFTAFYSPNLDGFGLVQGVTCCIVDVTDRQRAEEELRASEERYRVVVEQSMDAIVIGSMDGRLLYGNPASESLFGYRLEDVRGENVQRFFHPDDWPRVASFIGQGGEFKYEARMIAKDGSVLFVENARSVIHYDGEPGIVVQIRDVTERHMAEQRLRHNEERLQMALDSTEYGLWELWPGSGIIDVPARVFRDSFGYHGRDLERDLSGWLDLAHDEDRDGVRRAFERLSEGLESSLSLEFRLRDVAGQWRWVLLQGRVVEADAQGRPVRLLGMVQDMTERRNAEERLRELATTDSLTGLVNRRSFLDLAEREFKRSQRYGAALSLLVMDMDRFKTINDTYGHEAGDKVLQSLAAIGGKVLREVDVMGRLGGEEFAVLLPETGMGEALGVAERLRASVESSPVETAPGTLVPISVSIGAAQAVKDETLADLLRRADTAMYDAKNQGRNRVAGREAEVPPQAG